MKMKNPNPGGTASSGSLPAAVPRNAGGVGSIKPKIKRRLPPLPSSPVSNPDSPVSVGGSGGPRGAGGAGSLPPFGKGPAVIPRPRNPSDFSVNVNDGINGPKKPFNLNDVIGPSIGPDGRPLQGRGNALPMPVANLPGISNPGGPRPRNAGGVGSLPPQGGGADNPVSSDGGSYGNPQWGPGAEGGISNQIGKPFPNQLDPSLDQYADIFKNMPQPPSGSYGRPGGSGGIYAGGPGSLPPQLDGGGSMGYEGEGPAPADPSQIQGQDPRMQGFLDKINLPARFGGDPQAAMKFLQQNPQSHFGQRFAGYNQNQARRGQPGILQPQSAPMQYNPLLNMG